jgi:hypothetical protein
MDTLSNLATLNPAVQDSSRPTLSKAVTDYILRLTKEGNLARLSVSGYSYTLSQFVCVV